MENPGVPLRSANKALDKLDACSNVRFHGELLRMASHRLLRADPIRVYRRGRMSSPRLNRSSTASVFGPMLIKGEMGAIESGMTSGTGAASSSVYRKASAGRRWRRVRLRMLWEGVLGGCNSALGVTVADLRTAADFDRCRCAVRSK